MRGQTKGKANLYKANDMPYQSQAMQKVLCYANDTQIREISYAKSAM